MKFNKQKIREDIISLNGKIEDNFSRIEILSDLHIKLVNNDNIDHVLLKKHEDELSLKLLINKLYLGLLDNLMMIISQFDDFEAIDVLEDISDEIETDLSLRDEWIIKTKEKEVLFNDYHPFYDDNSFFNEIFSHFEHVEEYEMCKYLLNIQKLKTQNV